MNRYQETWSGAYDETSAQLIDKVYRKTAYGQFSQKTQDTVRLLNIKLLAHRWPKHPAQQNVAKWSMRNLRNQMTDGKMRHEASYILNSAIIGNTDNMNT